MVLFIMLHSAVLPFKFLNETLSVTIQMKAIEQYFPVVLFVVLYRVTPTIESNRICGWSTEVGQYESAVHVLSSGVVSCAYCELPTCNVSLDCKVKSRSSSLEMKSSSPLWPFRWKLLSSTCICTFFVIMFVTYMYALQSEWKVNEVWLFKEPYFHVELLNTFLKLVLSFESVRMKSLT